MTTVSKLIKRLEKIEREHGDIPVKTQLGYSINDTRFEIVPEDDTTKKHVRIDGGV